MTTCSYLFIMPTSAQRGHVRGADDGVETFIYIVWIKRQLIGCREVNNDEIGRSIMQINRSPVPTSLNCLTHSFTSTMTLSRSRVNNALSCQTGSWDTMDRVVNRRQAGPQLGEWSTEDKVVHNRRDWSREDGLVYSGERERERAREKESGPYNIDYLWALSTLMNNNY